MYGILKFPSFSNYQDFCLCALLPGKPWRVRLQAVSTDLSHCFFTKQQITHTTHTLRAWACAASLEECTQVFKLNYIHSS